jgi:hypothetical protein
MTVHIAGAHAHVQRLVSVVKMVTVCEEYTNEEQCSVVRFLWTKGLNAKDIHKKVSYLWKEVLIALSISQLSREILSRMFKSCRSPCSDCDRSKCAAGRRVVSSWQEDNDRQCSNCTRVFLWFSIQHNAWLFEVLESARMVGAQRTEGSRKNEPNGSVLATSLTVCRWRRRYA